MFDFNWSEIALIGIVALIFIGPKDMPTALRGISTLIRKGRKLASEFQTHVDDMVRDADLGEARESLHALRGMNLRSQVMKAFDGDGTLRGTLTDNPLGPVPAAASGAIPDHPVAVPARAERTTVEMLHLRNRPHGLGTAATPPTDGPQDGPQDGHWDGPQDAPDAPALIPPATARRLRRLRDAPPPPAFVPPHVRRSPIDMV